MSNEVAIQVDDLKFAYEKQQGNVLDIPCWQVQKGERVFVQGRSGAGKSTLLNLLAGLLIPQSGAVSVLQQNLSELSARQRDKFRANHLGIVFQQFNLVPYLSVADNLLLAARFAGQDSQTCLRKQQQLFEQLQLAPNIASRKTAELSVGQQQRVAIARALINSPQIVIADEPTSALDQDTRDSFIDALFSTLNAHHTTLIFVSHDQTLATHFDQCEDIATLNAVANHRVGSNSAS